MKSYCLKFKLILKYLLLIIEYFIAIAYIIVIPVGVIFCVALLEPDCWNRNTCAEASEIANIVDSIHLILIFIILFTLLIQIIWLTHRSIAQKSLNFKFSIITFVLLIIIHYSCYFIFKSIS